MNKEKFDRKIQELKKAKDILKIDNNQINIDKW